MGNFRSSSRTATPAALLALLADCDATAASLHASVPCLAALTAGMELRSHEWAQLAAGKAWSTRSALLVRRARVLGSGKRLLRKQCKRIDADSETAELSTEQLRVWAAIGLGCTDDCVFAALPLLAPSFQVQAPAFGVMDTSHSIMCVAGELCRVATGDGLRVVSAAGSGLKWFEPHARNKFSVVLAQTDGSVPVWLTTCDVDVTILPAASKSPAAAWPAAADLGTVTVVYEGFPDDAPEAWLQLTACGIVIGGGVGGGGWSVCVRRRPLTGHKCVAAGVHVSALAAVEGIRRGMAVSADGKWLVLGLKGECTIFVYSLPGGELVRTFGGRGKGPLQFKDLFRLCFAPSGHLVVVDGRNARLQEVTLEGVFVRYIGVGEFGDGWPFSVAVQDDENVIAVGCATGTGPRVVLFDFGTGAVTSRFGNIGTAPGQLSSFCTGIRFTANGSQLIIAELDANRLSLFTTGGVLVKCIGAGTLGRGYIDVLMSVADEYVVADYDRNRVCVFSSEGSDLVRSWRVGGSPGALSIIKPTAFAAAGRHLFVMDSSASMGGVLVFE